MKALHIITIGCALACSSLPSAADAPSAPPPAAAAPTAKPGIPIPKPAELMKLTQVQPGLYALRCAGVDKAAANSYGPYLAGAPVPEKPCAVPRFGCSSVVNGDFVGRNMDYFMTPAPFFLVWTDAGADHHASLAVAMAPLDRDNFIASSQKNKDDINAYSSPEQMARAAALLLDGVNEKGVCCTTHVVNPMDANNTAKGTNPGAQDLSIFMVCRYILDHASTADEAIELLKQRNIRVIDPMMVFHWIVADANHSYIVEVAGDRLRYTDKKTFLSINAFFNGGFTQDPISNTTWYDNTGAQFTMPMNGPVSGNADLRLMVNAPIAKSKFSIFNMLYAGYNNSSNAMAKGQIDMSKYFIDGDKFNFDYDNFLNDYNHGNLSDKFTTNNTQTMSLTERIRFTYRDDIVEVTLGARTRINKSWYTVSASNKKATFSNQADASMNWTIPGGVNLIADFRYNWYNNYTTDQQPTAVLNAEISKLLCKNKLTLSLKGYDLLGQARNLNIRDTDNYHQEIRNNTLGRYIILSLTYRFGNFGKAGQMMRGGPGGHGPGGPGGPMGPRR